MSLSKPTLSFSTISPIPLFILKGVKGALILKRVVEGAPLNPIHCCLLIAAAHIIPDIPAYPGLKVRVLNM
jgi:hypothetical protein